MSDEQQQNQEQAQPTEPVFTPEHLKILGVDSIDEAKSVLAETKKAASQKIESEFAEISNSLSKSQHETLKNLFGESKADIIRGYNQLKEAGFVQTSKPQRAPTSAGHKMPETAPSNEFNYRAKWEELKKTNEIAARNFFLTHKNKILSQKSG